MGLGVRARDTGAWWWWTHLPVGRDERRQLVKHAQDEKAAAVAAIELERDRAEQRSAELEARLQSAETAMGSMLSQGVRPSLPSGDDWKESTTAGLAKLIEACWATEREARPTFGGEGGVVSQLDGLEVGVVVGGVARH